MTVPRSTSSNAVTLAGINAIVIATVAICRLPDAARPQTLIRPNVRFGSRVDGALARAF